MYSPLIVDQRLAKLKKRGITLQRHSIEDSIGIAGKIGRVLDLNQKLTPEQVAFQRSEQILCRSDFRYWAERYGYTEIDSSDGGGIGPAKFWQSQERALSLIAAKEEQNHEEFAKHGFAQGILGVWHKTRQQGATALIRLICGHRMTLYKQQRLIAASLDDTKVRELYKRDHIWLDNLPAFLRPTIEYDVKDSHISFKDLKSAITYQQANQQAGVGTSQQFDLSHMTEVALWDNAWRLELDFMPAIGQSLSTFVGFESTANGRGPQNFWYIFTENIRKREEGYERWIYIFTPHYINSRKNRLPAGDDWRPNVVTIEHAELVEATSAEFAGEKIVLSRDQMCWWQTDYERHRKQQTLHLFLSNYPATPQQSFQHHARTALPIETIEWMRATSKIPPMLYNVEANQRVPLS